MIGVLQKIRSLPKGVKASFAFFFASLVTSGIHYLVVPIYTRLLTPEEYGQTALFLTWTALLGMVAMFCLKCGVFNNGMIDYPDKRDEYSASMLALSNVITFAFSAIFLSFYPIIKNVVGLEFRYFVLMCVIFVVQPAYDFWVARQRFEYKYKFVVLWTILCAFLSPCVAIVCILITPENRLCARLFGAELTLIIIYIGFYIYIAIKGNFKKINVSYWKFALLFNLPLIPHYLSTYLLAGSDRIMISWLVDNTATAFYSVAYSAAVVVTIVWSAVNSSLLPYTYECCKNNNLVAISRITQPLLTVFAFVCLLSTMLAPEIVSIMATKDYFQAIYVIPPVVGGVFFQVQYYIYANIVYYYKKPRYVMYASVTAMLANLGLNYLFIPRFGFIAAGYTTLFCYLLQAVIDYFAMKKVVGNDVYNMKYIVILSSFVMIVSLVSNQIYDHIIIRYAVITLLIIIGVVKREKIKSIFTSIRKKTNET